MSAVDTKPVKRSSIEPDKYVYDVNLVGFVEIEKSEFNGIVKRYSHFLRKIVVNESNICLQYVLTAAPNHVYLRSTIDGKYYIRNEDEEK